MKWPFALPLLLCFASVVHGQDPVRVLVITRSGLALPQAFEAFQKRYGKGLLELEISGDEVPKARIDNARVIFFYYSPNALALQIRPEIRAAHEHGALILGLPKETNEQYFGLKFDAKLAAQADDYWKYGGVENLTAFLALIYQAAGGERKLSIPPPFQATR